jgi:hypothetical protein
VIPVPQRVSRLSREDDGSGEALSRKMAASSVDARLNPFSLAKILPLTSRIAKGNLGFSAQICCAAAELQRPAPRSRAAG